MGTAEKPQQVTMTRAARRVLEAAERLFYERGIHAVGVDLIAAEARVTKKTLYDRFGSKERIVVERGDPLSLVSLGFKNVVSFDGIEVTWEVTVPVNVGYIGNMRNVSLFCMDEDMFRVEGPEYDIHTQSWNAVVSTLSNLKFKSPRNFAKLLTLA